MKPTLVGIFPLGSENVSLFVNPEESGGVCDTRPDDVSLGRITVGLDHDDWETVVEVLLHEVVEYITIRHGHRYSPNNKVSEDYANFLFLFDHVQFTQICAMASQFVTPALPKLAAAYKRKRR